MYLKAIKGDPYVISGPGEYEIGGVFVTALQTDKKRKAADKTVNTLYLINYFGSEDRPSRRHRYNS